MSRDLESRYPFLRVRTTVEDYVSPDYYNLILKDYVFDGRTDLDHLSEFLKCVDANPSVLELGCGTGRATTIVVDHLHPHLLDLVDLSRRMIEFSQAQFEKIAGVTLHHSDAIEFIENTDTIYDFIFSLWSLSHSIHQILDREGFASGKARVINALHKMVLENMKPGSTFFLIHFDSESVEQAILMRQWNRVFSFLHGWQGQSPSKRIIDSALLDLSGVASLSCDRYIGTPIIYSDIDEALEIFLNFHLESFFNGSVVISEVVDELRMAFEGLAMADGRIAIQPGCFIYRLSRTF